MKILTFLFLALCLLSCSKSRRKVNPLARKLNDSATNLVLKSIQDQEGTLAKAVSLLDSAIKIDSDYYLAYQSRFTFQTELKRYSEALKSAKYMSKRYPNDPIILTFTGEAYERTGDTIHAAANYKKALFSFNKILDTMSTKNNAYSTITTFKAEILTLLNKKEQGDAYLKGLIQTDPANITFYQLTILESKKDILYGKNYTAQEDANPVKLMH